MTELYLIAHKVRGQPAFDIATCEAVNGEEHWIIPTSGHRAYPYWYEVLDIIIGHAIANEAISAPGDMPADLPDHYTVKAAPKPTFNPEAVLRSLGLAKPRPAMNRRI